MTFPDRIVWRDDHASIIARGAIYRFTNDEGDDLYARTAEEFRARDRRGIMSQDAIFAIFDDAKEIDIEDRGHANSLRR